MDDEKVTLIDQLTVALDHLDKVLMADIDDEVQPHHAKEILLAYDAICLARYDMVDLSKKFDELLEIIQRF